MKQYLLISSSTRMAHSHGSFDTIEEARDALRCQLVLERTLDGYLGITRPDAYNANVHRIDDAEIRYQIINLT